MVFGGTLLGFLFEKCIDFSVILRSREAVKQFLIKHEFMKRLHKRCGEEGITIPYPIRTLDVPEKSAGRLPATWNAGTYCHDERGG